MLISRQLTNRLIDDARMIRKRSLELQHDCRNTRCISRLLRSVTQEERIEHASAALGTLFNPNNPPKGTA
jgi:hypothetical protein